MTSSPESSPVLSEALTSEERALLDVAHINDWRGRERDALRRLFERSSNLIDRTYVDDFNAAHGDLLDDYLTEQGIDADSSYYPEIRSLYSDASIINIDENEWGNSPSSRGDLATDDRPGVDIFAERIHNQFGDITVASDDAEDTSAAEAKDQLDSAQRAERIEALEREIPELAAKKHDAHMKLMTARMWNRKERQKTFDEANLAYAAAVNELLRHKAHDKSPEERKDFYETEVNRLHSEDNDAQHQYMLDNGGKMVKFLEKYSKMSAKEKLKFGAKLAGAALAGGVVLGIAAGAVGTAGVAVVAGRKGFNWFKSYELAKADLFKKHDVNAFEYDVDDDNDEEQLATYYRNENEAVIERNEKVRRKARTAALGGLAIGSAAGLAGGVLGTALHTGTVKSPVASIGHSGSTNDHWKAGYFEDINTPDGNDVQGNVVLSPDDINDHLPKSNLPDGDVAGGGHEVLDGDNGSGDSIPDMTGPDADPYHEPTDQLFNSLSENAHMITRGEGLFQTFAEHGVPKEHWNELLGELGPKLDDEYPGLVYRDPSIGGWGFTHTGKLPEGASRMILDAANKHGWAHINPVIVTG